VKPFYSFILKRSLYLIAVLFVTLLVTVALLGPTFDKVLKGIVTDRVTEQVNKNPKLVSLSQVERNNIIKMQIDQQVHDQGLDEPWFSPKRLYNTLFKVMILDLGRTTNSYQSSSGTSDIQTLIMERLPRTILLFGTSTAIVSAIGIYLGAFIAGREGSIWDKINSGLVVFSNTFPYWWIAMLMIFFFAFSLRIFPAQALPQTLPSDPNYIFDLLYHMTLPLLTLVIMGIGTWAFTVRYYVLLVLSEDFIRAKRITGISERRILYSHALKNAAPPIFTSVALGLTGALSGGILTETVFNWPGMGLLYYESITNYDIPVIVGLTYLYTLIFVVTIFIIDLAYGYFDPRLRVGGN
jgi:peptide/nickel transport system permease protein